jgi:hypothetical protein
MLPSPQERLLLEDVPKGPKIIVPRDTKLLSPKPSERLLGVKTNKLGEVTYVKYTIAPRVSLLMTFVLHQANSSTSL